MRALVAFAGTRQKLPVVFAVWVCVLLTTRFSVAEIELPYADWNAPITVRASQANRWRQGAYEVWHLRGKVELEQAEVTAACNEAVIWVDRAPTNSPDPSKAIAYLEGDVVVDHRRGGIAHRNTGRSAETIAGPTWHGRFLTRSEVNVQVSVIGPQPDVMPKLFRRAQSAVSFDASSIQPVQFAPPFQPSTLPPVQPPTEILAPPPGSPLSIIPGQPSGAPPAPGFGAIPPGISATAPPPPPRVQARDLIIQSRGGSKLQIRGIPSADQNEMVVVCTGGVNVLVEGIENLQALSGDRIDLEADRLVVWTGNLSQPSLVGQTRLSADTPLEFYMEGNIVFRDGDRVVYADRMYYNANRNYGVVLNAEVLTPAPAYQGLLRLKADVLQQLDRNNFQAYGAAVTSSRLGVPRYWFQSQNVLFQDYQQPMVDPYTGQPVVDPVTLEPYVDHKMLASSLNNFLYIGGLPVAYWPTLATDLTKPTFYLDRIRAGNDNVFGTQLLLDFDLYQLLGWENAPANTNWGLSTDYLSERGFGLGTNFNYDRASDLFGPGRYLGSIDAWGIDDHGLDNLGADRRAVPLEENPRGRVLAQHRHYFSNGYQLTAEFGLISDRNFLEQYYEREFDEEKDQITGLELKRYNQNSSWSVIADARLNDFFTQTESLPRFDHTLIGQSFFFDRLTWHAHSHVGYARLRTADAPTNPVDLAKFDPLAWETESEGLLAATRHEVDLPLELGPVKVTPYVLGELAHWGEDLNGVDVTRAYGQAGVRASLPFWKADPTVQNVLFNLNGLAHKVTFETDFFWADANQNLDRFPLYDPLDDDAQEHFRRRFFFDTFGGVPGGNTPIKFDERFYALRSGMQSWVTAPSTEIADDLMLARLGIRQRWQTKRGPPGRERIIDWIVLDIDGILYPKPGRDNFGQELGMLDYDFRWHIGDRLTLLSDGYMDFFGDGLRTVSVGGAITRPERGTLYLGIRSIEGPITSNIISASASYRMTEKWIFTGGASLDLGPTGSIGQTLSLTRVGESALVRVGLNVDDSRNNVGVNLSIEPRFLPSSRLGYVGGVQIPPAGAYGLE